MDTGTLDTHGTDKVGAELVAVTGPLSFASEFISSWSEGRGAFKRTKPKESYSLSGDGSGAWEIAARYSHLDLGHKNGGIQNNFSTG